ncbi:MAG: hypothetical protein AAF500_18920 [Myxococcota bacterium]
MRNRNIAITALACALLTVGACGDSSNEAPSQRCVDACVLIENACNSTTPDCAEDCQDDLDECPVEMNALLDCVEASVLQCDAAQDQGLAEAPCEADHAALEVCGADAF